MDVSDTTILVPLGETASTLPVTLLNAETGFVVLPTLAKVITINPFSLPRNAVFPCLSKSSELGVFGRVAAPPNVFAGIAIETIELVQAKFVPHPVLATHTVPLGVALSWRGVRFTRAVAVAAAISMLAETLQYVSGQGRVAQTGDVYNAELIDRSVESLTFAAGTRGFVFIDIRLRVTRNRDTHTIDLISQIEEGSRGRTAGSSGIKETKGPSRAPVAEETEQSKAERKARNRRLFELRTQMQSVERQLEKYSEKKKTLEEQLHATTDAAETNRLKDEHIAVVEKLAGIEERWLALQQAQEKEGALST